MSVCRVEKNKNYTVMSNFHLRDKKLSLKAKGLMSVVLSLPENWDYSIAGLVSICKEKTSSVETALNELKANGYLVVGKIYPNESNIGRIEYIYTFYESPIESPIENQDIENQDIEKQGVEKQGVEKQPLEIQGVENRLQLSTEKLSTEKLNTYELSTEKKKYGEFENVLLTDEEYKKLKDKFSDYQNKIDELSLAIESKGYKYKSHYATILVWSKKDKAKDQVNTSNNASYDIGEYNKKAQSVPKYKRREK